MHSLKKIEVYEGARPLIDLRVAACKNKTNS